MNIYQDLVLVEANLVVREAAMAAWDAHHRRFPGLYRSCVYWWKKRQADPSPRTVARHWQALDAMDRYHEQSDVLWEMAGRYLTAAPPGERPPWTQR